MGSMNLQEVHDRLIAARPEGHSCPEDCPFCSGEYATFFEEEDNVSETTYTEAEAKAQVDAAVAKAIAPIQAELDEFKNGQAQAEADAKVAEARAELEAQIADLTTKLDAAVIEAKTATDAREELEGFLTAEAEKVQKAEEAAARREERIAKVAEVITFPEEHVKERADKWAEMEEADFEALVADYKAMDAKKESKPNSLPSHTALHATREPKADGRVGSELTELIRGHQFGVDVRATR